MKLTRTIVECTSYSIINHIDSDDHVTSNALQCSPLRCSVVGDEWKDAICKVSDEALRRNFVTACSGNSSRWRLLRIRIHDGTLCFAFADLHAPERSRPLERVVMFNKLTPSFYVTVERAAASEPDSYHIEYYGKEGDEISNEGEFEIALIEEERNGQRYADESIFRRSDKYYLSSYRFD